MLKPFIFIGSDQYSERDGYSGNDPDTQKYSGSHSGEPDDR